jgi:hypothetical protein
VTHDLPPQVRDLARDGRYSYIDEWQRRDDGWWAHLWWIEDNPKSGTAAVPCCPVKPWRAAGAGALALGSQDG